MATHGKFCLASLAALVLYATVADAVILYGNDNSANQSDPGTGAPWGNVAEIVNDGGSGLTGSAVYIGDGDGLGVTLEGARNSFFHAG